MLPVRTPAGPTVPAPYSTRPLSLGDVQAVTDVMAACELHVLGEVLIERGDIEADWRRPSTDVEHRGVAVLHGEAVVGYAEVTLDNKSEGFVHPEHEGRGIGRALLDWSQQVGRAHGLTRVGQSVPDANHAARALFVAAGYTERYTSWILSLPPDRPVPEVQLPEGYALRDLQPGRDERVAYQVVEDAFGEWEGWVRRPFEDWAAAVLDQPGFEPWQVRLATDPAGRVVGACHLLLSEDTGWVHQVAVEPGSRGRGLARAMLGDAFGNARARGRRLGELSTDSRTGALDLYRHVGMEVTSSFTHWAHDL